MTDIKVRGLSTGVVAALEEQAALSGLSREEYLRRLLAQAAARSRLAKEEALRLIEPLPCGVWIGKAGVCGTPAGDGLLRPAPVAGQWLIQPICQAHIDAIRAKYEALEASE